MTKKQGLRPTLPADMDSEFEDLISDCWNPEPALRPSFPVILLRLQSIGASKSSRDLDRNRSGPLDEEINAGVKEMCRTLNDILWDYAPERWNQEQAAALIDKDATVTARDPVLHQILLAESGPCCAKALGWMMFGGLEDGAEICPEPVLDTDITPSGSLTKSFALLKTRFAVIAPAKIKQWRVKDTREFDGLQAALQASEKSIKSWGIGGLEAATSGEDSRKSKNEKRKRRRRSKPKKSKKDARVENFIKAARFVRGYGAASIHPSAKIQLHGLRMQALEGDCSKEEAAAGDGASSATALQGLKLEAWRSFHGKSQESAMNEYLELLTSLAPNWKVAHVVLGRQTDAERRKPKEMMWVLKVGYKRLNKEDFRQMAVSSMMQHEKPRAGMRRTTAARKPRGIIVTWIDVLQSSNASNAKLWSNEAGVLDTTAQESQGGKAKGVGNETTLSETAAFIAGLPKNFTLSDCIIDKDEHATM